MTDSHDEDGDFEAFLRREDDLSAQLGELDQFEVPPGLDARIRAGAREALREPLRAANDARDVAAVLDGAPARPPRLLRWRVPLGLAAVAVIGVSLGLRWEGWRTPAAPGPLSDLSEVALPAAPPAPAEQPSPPPPPPEPQPAAPEALRSTPQAPIREAVHARVRAQQHAEEKAREAEQELARQAAEQAAREAAQATVRAKASDSMLPPAPAPAAAPAAPDSRPAQPIAMPAPAAPPASPAPPPPPPAPASFGKMPPPPYLPPQAVQPEIPARRAAPQAAPAAAMPENPRARQWLGLIDELLARHLDEDARDAWQRFRREFPDYPVPAELRRRIEALETPPGR